ncbi:hypothetical protein SS50377_22134 [Spironucleus salmonicida]|uniref:Uncharacterized protein n=1 Tax=Spironucleus salmonicida TaxID=348837 RepID=V6LPS2_9EUKA|nr:hypothetical protein SS50377_22134 [Spironucleus salmonicida]|eukprot:EST45706.1 hypothetical protein SS50377_14277 [Spironucleus salmonicida]
MEFNILLKTDSNSKSLRIMMTISHTDVIDKLNVQLHCQQDPFFLFNCDITASTLTEKILQQTDSQILLSSLRPMLFDSIIPNLSENVFSTAGDVATFYQQQLQFASIRGAMRIPFFTIKFDKPNDRALAEHVFQMNSARISQQQNEISKLQEAVKSAELQIKNAQNSQKTAETQASNYAKELSQMRLDMQSKEQDIGKGNQELNFENKALKTKIGNLESENEQYKRMYESINSEYAKIQSQMKDMQLRINNEFSSEQSRLLQEVQQLKIKNSDLENKCAGHKDQVRSLEEQITKSASHSNNQYQYQANQQKEKQHENFVQFTGSQYQGNTQSVQNNVFVPHQQQYVSNISIKPQEQNAQQYNPFGVRPQTPIQNNQNSDIYTSRLGSSRINVDSILQKYQQSFGQQRPQTPVFQQPIPYTPLEYKPYVSPPKQVSMSSSTMSLMQKYLQK